MGSANPSQDQIRTFTFTGEVLDTPFGQDTAWASSSRAVPAGQWLATHRRGGGGARRHRTEQECNASAAIASWRCARAQRRVLADFFSKWLSCCPKGTMPTRGGASD